MIVYIENPKEIWKKSPIITNKQFQQGEGHKINIWKLIVLLYASNEQVKNLIKKTFIYNSTQKDEIFRINLIR